MSDRLLDELAGVNFGAKRVGRTTRLVGDDAESRRREALSGALSVARRQGRRPGGNAGSEVGALWLLEPDGVGGLRTADGSARCGPGPWTNRQLARGGVVACNAESLLPESGASMKAMWNNQVIAESDDTVVVEGNHYFPRAALDTALLTESETTTFCPWKGTAHYYHLTVGGETNPDAVWYYPEPKPAASEIEGRVAFWHGVDVTRHGEDVTP